MKEIEELINAEKNLCDEIIDLITDSKEKVELLIKISFYRESLETYKTFKALSLREPFNGFGGYYDELFDADISFDGSEGVLGTSNYNSLDVIVDFESPIGDDNPYGDVEDITLKLKLKEINSSVEELEVISKDLETKLTNEKNKIKRNSETERENALRRTAKKFGYKLVKE